MYIVKYGSFYISWYNPRTFEFGVDVMDKAKVMDRQEIDSMISLLGLFNAEVVRV